MKIKPNIVFTWGREPIDVRAGVMFGSQYDYVLLRGERTARRCLCFDLSVGMVWACLRIGLVVY